MKRTALLREVVMLTLAGLMAMPAILRAHDVLYPGTVLAVEAKRVQVKTVDPESKKDITLWFTITKDTQVKRGDRIVPYADANVRKDERIVVVITHEEMGKDNPAKELRLAAK
jgi:hypothetical protein